MQIRKFIVELDKKILPKKAKYNKKKSKVWSQPYFLNFREFLRAMKIQDIDIRNAYNQIHGYVFSVTLSHKVYFHIPSLKSWFKAPEKLSSKVKKTPERSSLFEIKEIITSHIISNDDDVIANVNDDSIWKKYTFSAECLDIIEDFQNCNFLNMSQTMILPNHHDDLPALNIPNIDMHNDSVTLDDKRYDYHSVNFDIKQNVIDIDTFLPEDNCYIHDSEYDELNRSCSETDDLTSVDFDDEFYLDSQSIKRNYNEMNSIEQIEDEYVNTKKQKIYNNNMSPTLFRRANPKNDLLNSCDEVIVRNKNTRD